MAKQPRWRFKLRTILLAVSLAVLVIPLGGVDIFRIYEGALVMSVDFSQSSFEIKANDGSVEVTGALPTWLAEDRVVEKIQQIPGVKNVRADFVNAPDMIFGE